MMPEDIESGDLIELQVDDAVEYDVFEVHWDGNDYWRMRDGLALFNINKQTPRNGRQFSLALSFSQAQVHLDFCVILSSKREKLFKSDKCPAENCKKNRLRVWKGEVKLSLTDNEQSHKVNLREGESIEISWTSRHGNRYRMEERRYCPVCTQVHTLQFNSQMQLDRAASSKGNFQRTFEQGGTYFLFRLTETNELHDMIICIVKGKYWRKYVRITDTDIQPNLISIEQNHSIVFQWNVEEKQTEPFLIDRETEEHNKVRSLNKRENDWQMLIFSWEKKMKSWFGADALPTGFCFVDFVIREFSISKQQIIKEQRSSYNRTPSFIVFRYSVKNQVGWKATIVNDNNSISFLY